MSFLRPLALAKLSDLAANRCHHLEQIFVRLPEFAAEELDDTGDFIAAAKRKAERSMQPVLRREWRAREVGVLYHIGNPHGRAVGPNAARQADAWSKGGLAADGLERGNWYGRAMPHLHAPQHVRRTVHAPDAAHAPAERSADRLKKAWTGFRQRRSFRQNARQRILRSLPLLGLLAFGDVP